MLLQDKVVFITGGAQGFGKAVADAVLKKGAKVCLADIKQEQGETTEKELKSSHGEDKVMFVKCDVTNHSNFEAAFKSCVSKFGRVDIMCNNAGIMDESLWEKEIAINFSAVVFGTNLAIAHMRSDKGGKGVLIINTASMGGMVPTYWFPVYAGTKSAVYNFTSSWAENPDMKAAGIRLTTICPFAVKTGLLDLKEHQVLKIDDFKQRMEHHGYTTMEEITDAFLKVMEDDKICGGGVSVLSKGGAVHMKLIPVPVSADPPETT